ncbi:MAG: hypothetical protein HY918_05785 [Candidatus Doudnabacteria bacterium]|nr:hypothetical protein [Candidatus Doudnabacteria bacterium]
MKKKFLLAFIAALFFLVLNVGSAKAASLYFSPSTKEVSVGNIVNVQVLINTDNRPINNSQAVINFPTDLLEVVSLSKSGSIFSLWVEEPAFSNQAGTVSFNGGLPTPGYAGASGAALTISFRAKASGSASIYFSSGSVLANDGLGTELLQAKGQAQFILVQAKDTPVPENKAGDQNAENKNITPAASAQFQPQAAVYSATHPDSNKWYNQTKAIFSWKLPPGTSASQTSFDSTALSVPRVLRKPAVSTIAVEDIKDGTWYFNSRFLVNGAWTKTAAYKVQVDTAAPESLAINQGDSKTLPIISAHDALSGIDYFLVKIDGQEAIKIPAKDGSASILSEGISSGMHLVEVEAYDFAGNLASAKANIEFKQQAVLAIKDYSAEIKEGGRIKAQGQAPANSKVNILLTTEDGISRAYVVKSDELGNFSFRSEPIAALGSYVMWAEVADLKSARIIINVKQTYLTRIAGVMSLVSGLLTIENIIIAILFIFAIFGWLNYFMLRRKQAGHRK